MPLEDPDELNQLRLKEAGLRQRLAEAESVVLRTKTPAQWVSELPPVIDFPFASVEALEAQYEFLRSIKKPALLAECLRSSNPDDFTRCATRLQQMADFLAADEALQQMPSARPEVERSRLAHRRLSLANAAVKAYTDYLDLRGNDPCTLDLHIEASVLASTRELRSAWAAAKQELDDAESRYADAKTSSSRDAQGRELHRSGVPIRNDERTDDAPRERERDRVIDDVRSRRLSLENVNAVYLRNVYGRDAGLYAALKRGTAILQSPSELDQYLYSYGNMGIAGWEEVLRREGGRFDSLRALRLFDYGCGQGLSTVLLLDFLRRPESNRKRRTRVDSVVLVEPSRTALARASAVVGLYVSDVLPINRRLEDLRNDEPSIGRGSVGSAGSSTSDEADVHVFSEVLDVEGVDGSSLVTRIFAPNRRHLVYVMSNDRDFYGGVANLRRFDAALRGRFASASVREGNFVADSGGTRKPWRYFVYSFQG